MHLEFGDLARVRERITSLRAAAVLALRKEKNKSSYGQDSGIPGGRTERDHTTPNRNCRANVFLDRSPIGTDDASSSDVLPTSVDAVAR